MHAGIGVATGRSSDSQAWPLHRMAFLLTHLPGSEKTSGCLGVRSCLPLRGSSGFAPDSLRTFPLETSPASIAQDTVSLAPCQSKCWGFREPFKRISTLPVRAANLMRA